MVESLEALQSRLLETTSVELKWQALRDFYGRMGADQINYGIIDTFVSDRFTAPVRFLSTMDPTWLDYYGEKRLDIHDPHVEFVRQGNLVPYVWGESVLGRLDHREQREAVAQTVEAGLRSQLSVTLPDPLGGGQPVGGLTIGSSLAERDYFNAIRGHEAIMIVAGLLFHHHCIGEIRRSHVGAKPLSARERDCMALLAQGLRVTRIAEKLRLSEATVELHLHRARRKLGAATTAQAVARALMFGDIAS
ncbi:hypothetical protein CHU93_01805 [Sandarakinorhabdus cyanobacteriorum]|uniref:HTH luxR-type domain-containing protein n=1 Tax=Sandarakinorhabdus cyanobacteriorum TaxID=1981098 RepID=A0A255Z436_9SPHN|nr:helix-turn-helix transcriptional regulator [Sandarakinorhabdus cyanobacteriorum]OYQ35420.1 hypothetical protein CHU93_01805 [Sandarakinorhabdus cyanobacteriorum]